LSLADCQLDTLLQKYPPAKDSLIPILQDIQKTYRYLPKEVLREVSEKTDSSLADIYSVATFYGQFRLTPVGQHIISVCTGTACHVKGADRVLEAFQKTLNIPEGSDTDVRQQYTIQQVACLGCCTLAPVVQIDGITYGHLTAAKVPAVLEESASIKLSAGISGAGASLAVPKPITSSARIKIGLGSCCQAQGSAKVRDEVVRMINEFGFDAQIEGVGCIGMCHQTPLLQIALPNGVETFYCSVQPDDVAAILFRHFKAKRFWQRVGKRFNTALEHIWSGEIFESPLERFSLHTAGVEVEQFLKPQVRIATEYSGEIDPTDIDDYTAHGGFEAFRRAAAMQPDEIIDTIRAAGLRGRGGAGFPTDVKWTAVKNAAGEPKTVICNGDEGDPGAFMDRMLLESFPFRIIEGMLVAAKAVGAAQGIFYIRAEYPLAVERVRNAIEQCNVRGITGQDMTLTVKEGAGAFICGEETALLESIEGRRGNPRLKPPYPAQSGLFGKPTLINNVETFALVPHIINRIGNDSAPVLTKVFALAGKVQRGGLIEVPLGMTLREIMELSATAQTVKAIQIGGPSGGCIPAALFDTPVNYESLTRLGAIMGSGGLIVLDENDCMADIARYFLRFTQEQSCGKCTFCRIGTRRMLDILDRICEGEGQEGDLEKLETLARQVQAGSLCGLGRTAPNPVLSTLRYFRSEYESHLQGRCPAGKCRSLISYNITDRCNGCTLCRSSCPVEAITGIPYRQHVIDTVKCTKCNQCRSACPQGAIIIRLVR
jgi:NADH:ubiquinone oxidoreductase subunit F (NADH-binding)/NADH:ubiquinone oxidoreductase subunit E/NAD-dependent dihydropyrimidine dehydrogenase PreA subunit